MIEYKKEAFELFSVLLEKLKLDYVTILMNLKVVEASEETKQDIKPTKIDSKYIGKKMQILVEGTSRRNKERMEGRTRCNRIVVFDGGERFRGQLVDLNIIRSGSFTLYGDPVILK